jgi:hypothetical protein
METTTHHDAAVVAVGPAGTDGAIAARPLDYLDRQQFQRYIGACRAAGGSFNPTIKAQVTEAGRVADLVAALKAADFAVQLDPAIAAPLQAALAAVQAERPRCARRSTT